MIENLVINTVFCILGVILGFIVQNYELNFRIFTKKYKYKGIAFDLSFITAKYKHDISKRLRSFDFKKDFQREECLIYSYPKMTLTISQNNVKIEGEILVTDNKNQTRSARFKGTGKYLTKRGKDDSGFCYITVKNWDFKSEWHNVYLFNITVTKEIRGYWITENTIQKGDFVMGRLAFYLNKEVLDIIT